MAATEPEPTGRRTNEFRVLLLVGLAGLFVLTLAVAAVGVVVWVVATQVPEQEHQADEEGRPAPDAAPGTVPVPPPAPAVKVAKADPRPDPLPPPFVPETSATPAQPKATWKLPPRPDPLPIEPPGITEPTEVTLPGKTEQALLAGGGRFVVLRSSALQAVLVFDVSAGKVVRQIPLPVDEPRALLAAGTTKLLVYLPAAGLLQRYDLTTGRREASAPLPLVPPLSFCMGSSSAGPLVVSGAKGGLTFYDPATFEALNPPSEAGQGRAFGVRVWPSADGRTLGFTGTYGQPSGVGVIRLGPDAVLSHYQHWAPFYVFPGPDGRRVFAGGFPPLTPEVQVAPDAYAVGGMSGHMVNTFLPAAHGPYYLHVHFGDDWGRSYPNLPPEHKLVAVSIHVPGGGNRPLLVVQGTKHVKQDKKQIGVVKAVGVESRLFLVPRAKLLVVVDHTGELLRLIPVDLDAALAKAEFPYLFVTSEPPASATRGGSVEYPVEVKSKSGGVTFAVESGPPGMTISPTGRLAWRVPPDYTGPEVAVIVRIQDRNGAEAYHSFTLRVTDSPAG
jgi:hypothetical protein